MARRRGNRETRERILTAALDSLKRVLVSGASFLAERLDGQRRRKPEQISKEKRKEKERNLLQRPTAGSREREEKSDCQP
jgi:hypothetical protein